MNPNSGENAGQEPLASEKVTVDRKIFFLDLKENNRLIEIYDLIMTEKVMDFLERNAQLIEAPPGSANPS